MKVYRIDLPPHAGPLPVEPSPLAATQGAWRNLGVELWKARNGEANWAAAAARCYGPVADGNLAGALNLRVETYGLAAAFALHGLKTGTRGTHPVGVGARGTATIVSQLDIPEHPFFQPGRRFACRLRHANGSFNDDAACTLRGCALKFSDRDMESPFDMIFNSGTQGPLWSVDSFVRFSKSRLASRPEVGDFAAQGRLMDELPAYYISWIESVREAPDSYADLVYTSQVVFPYEGRDGRLRYCRYRLRRPDLGQESGLPDAARQAQVWNMQRNPEDDRPTDYLRQEWQTRLRQGPVDYMLQIQVREPADGDTQELLHLNRPWDEARHPWRDLAHIRLEAAMTPEETDRTTFTLAHQPPGLGIFHATSAQDYRSVAWARVRLYQFGQWARALRGTPVIATKPELPVGRAHLEDVRPR
ncbi:MAG: hypothetical protein VKP62_14415 [Candidatus Sericytochromatia bacterium]|nr:hypothetical protein [Candidatus Sericytochromatia bacterium]